MGNQGSALNDEPSTLIAQRNLQHFDHTFKASLYTVCGSRFEMNFGECKAADRPISLVCTASTIELIEDVGITSKKQMSFQYMEITAVGWDHANSQLKLTLHDDHDYVILTLHNSVEFEAELKLRFSSAASTGRGMKIPSPMYLGMFAGAHKPKPFQRKRPNVSFLPTGKLPSLPTMRNTALDLQRGSYKPCPQGESRRLQIALQHIYEGCNSFYLLSAQGNVRGRNLANMCRPGSSVVVLCDESVAFKPIKEGTQIEEFLFDEIADWQVIDNERPQQDAQYRNNNNRDFSHSTGRESSGLEISLLSGETVLFAVEHVRDVKHTMEYFWNNHLVETGRAHLVKKGSTHGRPIVTVHTLSGEVEAPAAPIGSSEVVDQDGTVVRRGARLAPRRQSLAENIISSATASGPSGNPDNKVVPPENPDVKKHWHKVVMHQGWLLKQGGVGVGTHKQWIKRYFVLYKTSQGHFMVYYADLTECPLYTREQHHRNIIDIAKTTFIRPGSNKPADATDFPAHCFDIVTTEREWTLCAESQENVQKWLQLMTRAVDEDVAILPDEELVFNVKPKLDPLQALPATDYSTTLRVSANGISVCVPAVASSLPGQSIVESVSGTEVERREVYFWCYTDFYKWSLICPDGKLALLVNVFADSSFSRRYEYVFRTKEASRLATAIEYFIEKFMSVMHVRLEAMPEELEALHVSETAQASQPALTTPHVLGGSATTADVEVDLLGLDITEDASSLREREGESAFGDDPFGAPRPPPPAAPLPPLPPVPRAAPQSNVLDLFDNDVAVVAAPAAQSSVVALDPFAGDDPFASDPFGASSAVVVGTAVAPPLSPQQRAQHAQWLLAALSATNAFNPLYEDGSLRVTCKVEVKASLARVTLVYANTSNSALITGFSVLAEDPGQWTRFDAQPATLSQSPQSLAPQSSLTQVLTVECLKPGAQALRVSLSYTDSVRGKRERETVDLPVFVCTFHEPLPLSGDDFGAKWNALCGAGQEVQQVVRPGTPFTAQTIQAALTSVLKFAPTTQADSSPFVLYGAATLRTGAKMPQSEQKVSVGSLLKIEVSLEAQALRVTARTVHPAASEALVNCIKRLLA